MEIKNGDKFKFAVCLTECLGTAVLVLAINLSRGDPYTIGLSLMCSIVVFGPICGAHYNPAVTVAVFIMEGKLSNLFFCMCILIAELIGAIIGCIIAYWCQ